MSNIVRSVGKFFKTTGDFNDFFLEVFSDDLTKFKMPENNEFSCSQYTSSSLDYLMKFSANRNINPKKFNKEKLGGVIMPKKDSSGKVLNFDLSSLGDSIHFQTIVDDHCDYIATDEKEVKDVATIIFNNKKYEKFDRNDFDNYLLTNFKVTEWHNYLTHQDGKKWGKYLVKFLTDKVLLDYSCKFESKSQKDAFNQHGQVFIDRLTEIAKIKKYESSEKNELNMAFNKEPFLSSLV